LQDEGGFQSELLNTSSLSYRLTAQNFKY